MKILLVDDSPVQLIPGSVPDDCEVVQIAESLRLAWQVVILDVLLPDWESLPDTTNFAESAIKHGKRVIVYTSFPLVDDLQDWATIRGVPVIDKKGGASELTMTLENTS